MNKLIISIALFVSVLGLNGVGVASNNESSVSAPQQEECKYLVSDAILGLKTFAIIKFVPKKTSADGKLVMGMALYHNPASANKESVDAVSILIINKESHDDAHVVLLVSYYNAEVQETTTFVRRIGNDVDKQAPSHCFDKTIEKVQNKSGI
jgi:hypothetical protein